MDDSVYNRASVVCYHNATKTLLTGDSTAAQVQCSSWIFVWVKAASAVQHRVQHRMDVKLTLRLLKWQSCCWAEEIRGRDLSPYAFVFPYRS